MQFSAVGFWGRGIYFAQNSAYSYNYSYRPNRSTVDERRASGHQDEREMFLAKLLIGSEVYMNRDESERKKIECKSLTVPPENPGTGMKYRLPSRIPLGIPTTL